jgi:hypothetical protein
MKVILPGIFSQRLLCAEHLDSTFDRTERRAIRLLILNQVSTQHLNPASCTLHWEKSFSGYDSPVRSTHDSRRYID